MPETRPSPWRSVTLQVIAGVVTVVAASLLAVMAYLGRYVRPTSDDWCALWKTRDMGILGITEDFYQTQNGRLANAFISGVVNVDGLVGMKVFPAFLVAAFGLGLMLLIREVWLLLGWRVQWLMSAAIATVLEVLLFAAAQNPYQALLWAPATISHTLPTAIGVWTVTLGLWAGRSGPAWLRGFALVVTVIAGFCVGTLNEPFMIIGGLAAGTVGLLVLPWFRQVRSWYPFAWCVAACAGMVTGYAVLYTSPGAQWRRSQNLAAQPLLSADNLSGSYHDWSRVLDILSSEWTYLAAVAIGVAAGLLVTPRDRDETTDETVTGRRPARGVLVAAFLLPIPLLLLGSFVIILGVRQGYGPTGWTYYRTWFSFVAPMVFALLAYGVLAGRGLRAVMDARRGTTALTAALVTAVLTAGVAIAGVVSLVPRVESLRDATTARAALWDKQDARIRRQAAEGVTVVGYKPLNIANLAEPFYTSTYSRDWVSACASTWYGVDRLKRLR
ncbi:hypothetical protein GCM10010168_00280 [Actinoplanes ianthinogenes]|uniref:Integral membrane protein n=1 Tax=Actinoplanes ianthinogenes TaxID=122358 RepID=A0ABN6CC82_9ACTN|nr:DUF6056 family protein [Actinoplanes ianthinogenes]BCJ43230.1 hypothetical protein Aiant_38870 [Actinoplanes ianthinogenes]GGQ89382.1 hypothetical protein GCM10010168_00280 [Actinoplanes ianthinogenes]